MIKGIAIGFVLGIAAFAGSLFCYFAAGMAPVATANPPIPFEKKLANMALDAHIEKQLTVQSPVSPDEGTFLAGVSVYKQHCAICHGLPGRMPSDYATTMYPNANGIRLSGMPAFRTQAERHAVLAGQSIGCPRE